MSVIININYNESIKILNQKKRMLTLYNQLIYIYYII